MSAVVHLDPARLRALLDGRLPREERRALARHLDGTCEHCEELLARSESVDALDGWADDAIFAAVEAGPVRLEAPRPPLRRPLAMRRFAMMATGLAAAVAAFAVLPLSSETGRDKGTFQATPLHLELLARQADGSLAVLAEGATIAAGSTVVFRVELPAPGCVHLWRRGLVTEPLQEAPLCFEAGWHVVAAGGQPLGLALSEEGDVTLAVLPAEGSEHDAVRSALERGELPPGGARVNLRVEQVP